MVGDVSEDRSRAWEARKRADVLDLGRLPAPSVLVTLADTLADLRSLRGDVEALGDARWQRDDRPFTRQRRYYRTFARVAESRGDLPVSLVAETRSHVEAVFRPVPLALEPLLAAVHARTTSAGSQIHGEAHWRTVAAVGHSLLEVEPTADPAVVFAFALLHDTMRENDHRDPLHGPRASAFAEELHAEGLLGLDASQLAVLRNALEHHTSGTLAGDPTTAVCWDADRLTLWRCGIHPDARFLSSAVDDWRPWIDRWYDVWSEEDWPALHASFATLE